MTTVEIDKELLQDIRHELMKLTGLKAFTRPLCEHISYIEVAKENIIELDFEEICTKIDEVNMND